VGKPRPTLTALNAPHFEALRDGELVLQRCGSCRATIYYPRAVCSECLSSELAWTRVSGEGVVISFAHIHKPQHPSFSDDVPIELIAVRLAEGPTVFGRLSAGSGPPLEIGMPVELDPRASRAEAMPHFRPARHGESHGS
jgi:uncharacterized OB-fold protein